EAREIEAIIRASAYRDQLELLTKWAVRPIDLLQFLNQHKPQIVHFSGHGTQAEEIVLLDQDRSPKPVSRKDVLHIVRAVKDNIGVVVLNACYSQPQAEAITEVIDCAIGMGRAVGDRAAIAFATSFYRALGFGRTLKNAFEQAKVALQLEGIADESIPQLLAREGVDPSGMILVGRARDADEF